MKRYSGLATSAITLGFAVTAFAAGQGGLPEAKTQGSITYVSGGIGSDEAAAMKQEQSRYPLSLIFSEGARGEYLAQIQVTIKSKDGKTLLQTVADGPIMLVRLPAGDYRIDAQAEGRTLEREAKVRATGDTQLAFNWPQT